MVRLRRIQEETGYTQQELADESGVSQHTIGELELGRRKPQGRTLRKLARVSDVNVRDLTAPTIREWALSLLEMEFDRWVESATLDQILSLNGELSRAAQEEEGGTGRHLYIVSLISRVVECFNPIGGTFELVETSRSC